MSRNISSTVRSQVESAIDTSSFNPKASSTPRSKRYIISNSREGASESKDTSRDVISIDIPSTDLVETLPKDILAQMVSSLSFLLLCFFKSNLTINDTFVYLRRIRKKERMLGKQENKLSKMLKIHLKNVVV